MKIVPCLLALLPLLAPGAASAQSIDEVSPDTGSLGTTLTITGTGLGGPTGLGKPSAALIDPASGKKLALKVLTFSDTVITAQVTKAAYGLLDLTVQPKGASLLSAEDAFTVPQPEITGVLPLDATGTLGTTVTIQGTGLFGVAGMSKPKVQLFHAATGKKYTLKVASFSDTEVTATITKAVAGELDLQLIPKAGATLSAGDFTVPLPNIVDVSPGFAFAGATITLDCEQVGNKKPKVKVGTKTAKVVSFSDTGVTFVMPKKFAKGVHDVQLINKIGTATRLGALINQGDAPDTDTTLLFSALVNKKKFVAGAPPGDFFQELSILGFYDDEAPVGINLTGTFYKSVAVVDEIFGPGFETQAQAAFNVIIPFDPNTFVEPVAFLDVETGEVEYTIPDPEAELFEPPLGSWSTAPDGHYTATILGIDPPDVDGVALVRGAFTGTLEFVLGTGGDTDTVTVTQGEFRVLVDLTP